MRKVQKPIENAKEVFRTCISIVDDQNLKQRLVSIETNIEQAANEFDLAASTATIHTLLPHDNVAVIVSKKEMVDVYNYRMVKKETPGRAIYDKLRLAPKYGICPLCGHCPVSTLDHHLPKDQYPALAVVPVNLVPACKDCNGVKLTNYAYLECEQTLHPYYDDISDDSWLSAVVFESSPTAVRFFVLPPSDWDSIKAARVRYHFKTFKIAKLYASQAACELVSIQHRLIGLFDGGGQDAVKIHLQGEAESREKANKNSWQTATYKALAANVWFCGGGFRCDVI